MSSSEDELTELDRKHVMAILKYVNEIKYGDLKGSVPIAKATVSLLGQIISDAQSATAIELLALVRAAGHHVRRALPQELVAANIVRRALRAIRDEHRAHANQSGEGAGESLQRLVLATSVQRTTLGPAEQDLRESIRDHFAELRTELESSASSMCSQAHEHVHAQEIVLTYGASTLAEQFLRAAAVKPYQLIVVEGPRLEEGHKMAIRLSEAGIPTTLVTNAAVFAVMSRVNKVVVSPRAVLAGGAVLGAVGMHSVTSSAKFYNVPFPRAGYEGQYTYYLVTTQVIVLAPLHKLSPLQPCEQLQFNPPVAPQQAMPYLNSETAKVHVYAPLYDLVSPDHITLFITNTGGSSPSYIYRLLSELYDPNDYEI